jgi:hypothetical protein
VSVVVDSAVVVAVIVDTSGDGNWAEEGIQLDMLSRVGT